MDCGFAQDVVAINTVEKHCCVVGELKKRAAVTPDVDSILDRMADLWLFWLFPLHKILPYKWFKLNVIFYMKNIGVLNFLF